MTTSPDVDEVTMENLLAANPDYSMNPSYTRKAFSPFLEAARGRAESLSLVEQKQIKFIIEILLGTSPIEHKFPVQKVAQLVQSESFNEQITDAFKSEDVKNNFNTLRSRYPHRPHTWPLYVLYTLVQ